MSHAELKDQVIDGLVTAAAFHGISILSDGVQLSDMNAVKRALVCGAADVASIKVKDMLSEHSLLPTDGASKEFVKPAITGALYVLADKYVTKSDPRSTLTKFLVGTGASYVGAAANGQVRSLIGQ